jgi:hypothetical protein
MFLEASVQTALRPLWIGFLAASLCSSVVHAGAAEPLGIVLQANRALLGGDSAVEGATVFDGEAVYTNGTGSLRIRLGASQAYLLPKSAAFLQRVDGGFGATLAGGTIVLSAADGETFRLIADGALIQPATPQLTVVQITMVSASELLIYSRRGALEVSVGEDSREIPEGASYRMLIDPSEPAGPPDPPGSIRSKPQGERTPYAARSRFVFLLLGAAAAGTGIGVWRAVQSPSVP